MKKSPSRKRVSPLRDASVIASAVRPAPTAHPALHRPSPSPTRSQTRSRNTGFAAPGDRRVYSPEPARLGMRSTGRLARVVAPPPQKRPQAPSRAVRTHNPAALLFDRPQTVDVCVRRGVRKEVLFARGAAGGPVRPPTRGPLSNVRCK